MIGSTIVFIPELPKNKKIFFDKIINQRKFDQIWLDALTSLDFEIINYQTNTSWEGENNPVLLDEENGAVLIHISQEGLKKVIEFKGTLDNVAIETQQSDIAILKNFIDKFGSDNLYECATF
jgi:hypothetical protein